MRKAFRLAQSGDDARLATFSTFLSLGTTLFILLLAAANGLTLGIRLVPAISTAVLLGTLAWSRSRHERPGGDARLAIGAGAVLILFCGGLAGGLICQVGQTFSRPFVDPLLHRADMMLGVDSQWIVGQIVRVPGLTKLLAAAYLSSFPLILVSVLWFAWTANRKRAWELCGVFNLTLLGVSLCSTLIPATGAFYYLHLPAALQQALRPGSGTYHLQELSRLRQAREFVINPTHLQGVATFPSFHTALALMTVAAWRDVPRVRAVMVGWQTLVIISTIPIGGHYAIDLIGGAICWAAMHVFWQKATSTRHGPANAQNAVPALHPIAGEPVAGS